jgi:hypothetical protein
MEMNRSLFGRLLVIVAIAILAAPILNAQAKKNYVIVANGQGPGSTAFSTFFSPEVTANLEGIGVVLASSSDPNFAARVVCFNRRC